MVRHFDRREKKLWENLLVVLTNKEKLQLIDYSFFNKNN